MKWIKRILLVVLVLAPAALLLFGWLTYRIYSIPTSSMEPTVVLGDRVVARLLQDATPKRGEMFVLNTNGVLTIKRVVAIGGDHVRIHDKKLFVNGQEQRESFVIHIDPATVLVRDEFPTHMVPGIRPNPDWEEFVSASTASGEVIVPSACSFALGDNRDNSLDSRYLGFYRNDQVKGRPVMVLYSVDKRDDKASGEFRWERLFKFL